MTGHHRTARLLPTHGIVATLLKTALHKLLIRIARSRATKESAQEPCRRTTGCSNHRAASRMTNHRTTDCPGCRSDRTPNRGTASNLPALALTRGRTSIFGHRAALVDIPIRHFFPDLL